MSDDLDPRLARLRDVAPPFPFAAPEAVRRRGEQRARRQASVAAVAVVAVTGVAVGLGSAVLQPSPPAPHVAAPSPTTSTGTAPPHTDSPDTVPSDWLLTAADLGPGRWGPWPGPEWENLQPPGWPPPECLVTTGSPARTGLAHAGWSIGTVAERRAVPWVHQVVERYRPGEAAAAFAVFRAGVGRCAGGDVIPGLEYAVVDDGFTGDESLLVRVTQTPADGSEVGVTYVGVVRVGDAVVTVRAYDPELGGADPEFLRRLAVTASARIAGD